jgi:hypothetical protein
VGEQDRGDLRSLDVFAEHDATVEIGMIRIDADVQVVERWAAVD